MSLLSSTEYTPVGAVKQTSGTDIPVSTTSKRKQAVESFVELYCLFIPVICKISVEDGGLDIVHDVADIVIGDTWAAGKA